MEHAEHTATAGKGEQHQPFQVYLIVWGLLFVLSALSYFLDYFNVHPDILRKFLITAFALIKAALIVGFFMHMRFERLGLVLAILLPPLLLMALVAIILPEGHYVSGVREIFFGR
ncbi:MAG: cytochrome C oxidase subunit IV [Meiothermus sp.]